MIRRHEVKALFLCKLMGVLAGLLKILAELDEVRALTSHGGVFFHTVSVRHDNRYRDLETLTGERNRLAMISPGGGDHAVDSVGVAEKLRRICHRRPRLECTYWRVVFMLHPHTGLEFLVQ